MHKKMFFNRRYGLLGMLSYPYWFFFEMLAPLVEFAGLVGFVFFISIGIVNWTYFWALLMFIFAFGFLYSIFAILMEVYTYNQYKNRGDLARLILTAFLEPLFFHPVVVWSAIKGHYDYLRQNKSWGNMDRKGFTSNKDRPV